MSDPRVGQSVTMPWAREGAGTSPSTPAAGDFHTGPLKPLDESVWGPEPDARGNFPPPPARDDGPVVEAARGGDGGIPWAHDEGLRLLKLWLTEPPNIGRPVTAQQLYKALRKAADNTGTIIWPSHQSMAGWFARNMLTLRAAVQVTTERHKNIKIYKFFPKLQAVR